ncbi:MAG TPA: hypothetical protein VF189_01505 [Patescibacteria group bacterium]
MASEFQKLIREQLEAKRAEDLRRQRMALESEEYERQRPERERKEREKMQKIGEQLELRKTLEIANENFWHGKGKVSVEVDTDSYKAVLSYPTTIQRVWEEIEWTDHGGDDNPYSSSSVVDSGVSAIPFDHKLELIAHWDAVTLTYPKHLPDSSETCNNGSWLEFMEREKVEAFPSDPKEYKELLERLIEQAKRTDPVLLNLYSGLMTKPAMGSTYYIYDSGEHVKSFYEFTNRK